ncbi:MAG: hypothetical protein ACFFDF_04465 [Candidatus Odinarchaeota archaeon]
MKYEKVLKFLEIIGSIFIIITLIELGYIILLNFTPFLLDGNVILLSEFVYSSTIFPFSGTLLWLFVNISIVCFLILGFFLFKISTKKNIESKPLAKLIIITGMVELLVAFVKMDFLVLLGKTYISTTFTTIRFQAALFSPLITAIMPAIFWIFFISVDVFFLLAGLCITAVGIKWTILQEKDEKQD